MDISQYNEYTNIQLSNSSQLKMFNILDDVQNNTYYLNIFRSYVLSASQLNDSSFYDLYEVDNNDWLDDISTKIYGTPSLWWVVAIVNEILNPFEDIYPGKVLRILKNSYIYNILKEVKNVGQE